MDKTHILILGSGGREHALGWKLKQSKRCGKLFFAPGNAGTRALGENVDLEFSPVNTKNRDAIDYFCRQENIGLIVVGPEDPLCGGIVDKLTAPGRLVFGPSQEAARLEGDKAFAKELMRGAAIPTADAKVFKHYEQALAYLESRETPVVIKATGLAKGKGVVVPESKEHAREALHRMMVQNEFGEASAEVLIEEKIAGQEVSILALVDGRSIYVLDPSQDHKQAHEGDTGPNTGGMGAYCPTPLVDENLMTMIEREVLVAAVDALRREGVEFKGVMYAGLMLTPGGPKVLEFNTRFGDPECQPLMVRLQGDLLEAMVATCEGRLADVDLSWDPRHCCAVVLASGGYPGPYENGKRITGIADAEALPGVTVFHAGTTKNSQGKTVTAGGRVLTVCALGDSLQEAQEKANAACERIDFEGKQYRKDIGFRVM